MKPRKQFAHDKKQQQLDIVPTHHSMMDDRHLSQFSTYTSFTIKFTGTYVVHSI